MIRKAMVALLVGAAWLPAMQARAAAVSGLLGDPVENLRGEKVGVVEELIVDVSAGRVAYVIVDSAEKFYTLPVRAFDERMRLSMELSNAVARHKSPEDPKLRRAGKLIGQPVTNPGDGRIGTITDIEFDPETGQVEDVVVETPQGRRNMPAAVLAHGRFPPLTRWQVEHPPAEVSERQGFVRREPSDERRRLHDHEWDRLW
jgi:sporulation protein YlmC with PRC-barrel domain